jgi:prenylcysteine oxidase/farnesylcysteine lyase
METETVSSRNVVDLLLKDVFDSSICGHHISNARNSTMEDENDYVYGWDC